MATRVGPRRTVIGGLLLLGLSSLVFGLANEIVLLDAARFAQGVVGSADLVGGADLADHDARRRSDAAR